jgi:hypothetical protein
LGLVFARDGLRRRAISRASSRVCGRDVRFTSENEHRLGLPKSEHAVADHLSMVGQAWHPLAPQKAWHRSRLGTVHRAAMNTSNRSGRERTADFGTGL